MSGRGNYYNNSVMESSFSTVTHELGEHFDSCGDAKMALFDYIELFYNSSLTAQASRLWARVNGPLRNTEVVAGAGGRNSMWVSITPA